MRLMKSFGVAALTLALAAGTASATTVKIGVVLPFSGANADLGHQMDKAFDLYVKLHAQDIAPHKVELVKRDDGADGDVRYAKMTIQFGPISQAYTSKVVASRADHSITATSNDGPFSYLNSKWTF